MDWIRQSPLFFAWLALCALAGVGGICWLNELRVFSRRETAVLLQRKAERRLMARADPVPTAQNERAVAAALAEAGRSLEAWQRAWQDRRGRRTGAPPPARSIDAYFEIASLVERMRALAARDQVRIRPEEHFGFTAYANHGPEAGILSVVDRQCREVEQLLEILFAARPRELLAVRRERPRSAAFRTGRVAAAGAARSQGEPAADYFAPDPTLVPTIPGLVDACMYRLEFTGQTPALRALLNGVAAASLPLVVRRVAVEPLAANRPGPGTDAVAAGAPVPLIAQDLSRFAVVVEYVDPAESENRSVP